MQWKQSSLYPDYDVSEYGDVRRNKPDKLGRVLANHLKSRIDRGYKKYRLYRDGSNQQIKASQLVLDAFVGPKPFCGAEACHNDGDKSNNHISNLRWDTHRGNHADTLTHGTRSRGERHGRSKLTEQQVVISRDLAAAGSSHEDLASRFNVTRRTIGMAVSGRTWSHVVGV